MLQKNDSRLLFHTWSKSAQNKCPKGCVVSMTEKSKQRFGVVWWNHLGAISPIFCVSAFRAFTLAWFSVWSKMQTCIQPSWCHCHSLSCFSKSRLVLPFWYRLTCVVPDKGPLNGCVCLCLCALWSPTLVFQVSSKSVQVWGSYNLKTLLQPVKANIDSSIL